MLRPNRSESVKLIEDASVSAAEARNAAFAKAQGDWIKFFDIDEFLNPEANERQMNRLGARVDAVASSTWCHFYADEFPPLVPIPKAYGGMSQGFSPWWLEMPHSP